MTFTITTTDAAVPSLLKLSFKYVIAVSLIINSYSCSPIETVIIHQTGPVFYQAGNIETDMTDDEINKNNTTDNCNDKEFISGNNNTHKKNEAVSVTSRDLLFYSKYSKKLGINFNGTENRDLLMSVDKWLGTRYKWGGCSKYGIDCSCFVKSVYKDVYGINLNRTSRSMYYNDLIPIQKSELQEGDILCFKMEGKKISHVGIYLKNNKFAHAIKKGVTIGDLSKNYYKKRFFAAGRVKGMKEKPVVKTSFWARTFRSSSNIKLSKLLIFESLYDANVKLAKKSKCSKRYRASASAPENKTAGNI
ncbi:C40 family peptidase [Desulfonema magnum]|uniref:Endopeptidase NLPC/P60 domain-containing protein n=1 Tax=Desulfonema magnum TaxID=45655 RepID=A0A975BR21_9BACT|nr:C40 family peptidase [Desulfonema magnum]QTA90081.1 Endopeptidase NLPC/P60 domain-containing protein [Desulfonema magnum]